MMSWVSRRHAVLVVIATVSLTACTSHEVPGSPDDWPPAPTIEIGQVGELPAGDRVSGGVSLVVPDRLVKVPGSYPLGSVVGFQIPVRNDGPDPIEIRRLEPG